MAKISPYVSGKVKELKVGITSYSEGKTSLFVTGNVGVGTTDPFSTVGVSNTSILAVGILTANKIFSTGFGQFTGGGVLVDNIVGTALSVSGISTLANVNVSGVSTFNDDIRVIDHQPINFGTSTKSYIRYNNILNVSQWYNSTNPIEIGYRPVHLTWLGNRVLSTKLAGIHVHGDVESDTINTGIITATTFSGDGSGLTNLPGISGNIVGTALSISGIASVGAAITMSGATGIISATAFYGDGSNLSGVGNTENVSTNSLVVSGISTLGHVGIGTTNYDAAVTSENTKKLSVGIVSAYEVYVEKIYGDGTELTLGALSGIATGIGTFIASAGVSTDVDTFAYASLDYKLAEYSFHFINGSNIQAEKLLVMQDNTTAFSNEFAIMSSSDLLVSVGATISGSNVLVQVTPETGISGLTTYRWRREVQE